MRQSVIGVALNESQAESMIKGLRFAGLPSDDISILLRGPECIALASHHRKSEDAGHEPTEMAFRSFELSGNRWGVGSTPEGGLFIAAGPILEVLATTEGRRMRDVFETIGMPITEALRCEEEFEEGHILIMFHANNAGSLRRSWLSFEAAGAEYIATILPATRSFRSETYSLPAG